MSAGMLMGDACPHCDGDGYTYESDREPRYVVCIDCDGTGYALTALGDEIVRMQRCRVRNLREMHAGIARFAAVKPRP